MRKIYLYGGSFNPIHNDHLRIVRDIVKIMNEDDRLFIAPCLSNPLETKPMAEFADRVNWCEKVFQPLDERIMVDRCGYIYFIEYLLDNISHEDNPDECEFIIVVGQDEYDQVHKWKSFRTINKLASFHVIDRDIDSDEHCSSSIVRDAINGGDWALVQSMVPKEMMKILNPWWESVEKK